MAKTASKMPDGGRPTMTWLDEPMEYYELSYGEFIYVPVFRCGACGLITESYVRFDEPEMPEEADRYEYCPRCGAKAANPGPKLEWWKLL